MEGGAPNDMMDELVSRELNTHGSLDDMPVPPLTMLLTPVRPNPPKATFSGMLSPFPAFERLVTLVIAWVANEVVSGMVRPLLLLLSVLATSPLLNWEVPNWVGVASYMSYERVPPDANGTKDPPTCIKRPSCPPEDPPANSTMMGTAAAGSVMDAVVVVVEEATVHLSKMGLLAIHTRAWPWYVSWKAVDPAEVAVKYPVMRMLVFAARGVNGGAPSV